MQVISPVNIEERKTLGIRPGDTVRVYQKIEERGKTRIQMFEGLVIGMKHGTEPGATFTVRATLSGVGVEKIFPLFSPMIDKIEIVKRSKVRRAKLYFIREKVAREMRRQLRRMKLMGMSTVSEREQEEARVKAAEETEALETEAAQKAEEEAKAKEAEQPVAVAAEETPSASEEAAPQTETTATPEEQKG
jgi:large subunit ribosomal protein L19